MFSSTSKLKPLIVGCSTTTTTTTNSSKTLSDGHGHYQRKPRKIEPLKHTSQIVDEDDTLADNSHLLDLPTPYSDIKMKNNNKNRSPKSITLSPLISPTTSPTNTSSTTTNSSNLSPNHNLLLQNSVTTTLSITTNNKDNSHELLLFVSDTWQYIFGYIGGIGSNGSNHLIDYLHILLTCKWLYNELTLSDIFSFDKLYVYLQRGGLIVIERLPNLHFIQSERGQRLMDHLLQQQFQFKVNGLFDLMTSDNDSVIAELIKVTIWDLRTIHGYTQCTLVQQIATQCKHLFQALESQLHPYSTENNQISDNGHAPDSTTATATTTTTTDEICKLLMKCIDYTITCRRKMRHRHSVTTSHFNDDTIAKLCYEIIRENSIELDKDQLRCYALVASIYNSDVIYSLPISMRRDRELLLSVVKRNILILKELTESSSELLNDKNFIMECMKSNSFAIQLLPRELMYDMDIVLYALKCSTLNTEYVMTNNEFLRDNKEFIMSAIKYDPEVVRYISNRLRTDSEVAMLALQRNGCCLKFFPDLQNDKQIVTVALLSDGDSFIHVNDESLKQDEQLITIALLDSNHPISTKTFQQLSLSDKMKSNKRLMLKAIGKNCNLFEFISKKLQDDKEVVLAALHNNPLMYQFASDQWKSNREIALYAMRRNKDVYNYLNDELKQDTQIMNLYAGTAKYKISSDNRRLLHHLNQQQQQQQQQIHHYH